MGDVSQTLYYWLLDDHFRQMNFTQSQMIQIWLFVTLCVQLNLTFQERCNIIFSEQLSDIYRGYFKAFLTAYLYVRLISFVDWCI